MSTLNADDPRPAYAQIADNIRSAITGGRYPPGSRLSTVGELAVEYGVAKMTVQKAFDLLRAEKYIESWHGRGTFVRDHLPSAASDPAQELAELRTKVDSLQERLDAQPDTQEQIAALRHDVAELRGLVNDLYAKVGKPMPTPQTAGASRPAAKRRASGQ